MLPPPISGGAIVSKVMLIGQAPGFGKVREMPLLLIDFRQEGPAIVEARHVDAGRGTQAVHAEVGGAGIAADLPGIIARAEEAGVLSGPN